MAELPQFRLRTLVFAMPVVVAAASLAGVAAYRFPELILPLVFLFAPSIGGALGLVYAKASNLNPIERNKMGCAGIVVGVIISATAAYYLLPAVH